MAEGALVRYRRCRAIYMADIPVFFDFVSHFIYSGLAPPGIGFALEFIGCASEFIGFALEFIGFA